MSDEGKHEWATPNPIADINRRLEAGAMVALVGHRGTGKTQLAADILRRWIVDLGRPGLYLLGRQIGPIAQSAFRDDAQGRDPLARFRTVPLLVIDEMHERSMSAFETQQFDGLIDDRYRHSIPSRPLATLLVGNTLINGLSAFLGQSVASRLTDGGRAFELKGESFRRMSNGLIPE